MELFRHRIGVSLFLVAAFAIITLAGTRSASQAASNVLVTNTTSQAVPVAVQGTPNVRSLQGGTWSVYLLGSPTLRINNAPSAPVPTQPSADKQAVMMSDTFGLAAGSAGDTKQFPNNYGKRLMVDAVSIVTTSTVAGEQGTDASAVVWDSGGHIKGSFYFPLHGRSADNISSQGILTTSLKVEPGEYINVAVERNQSFASNTCGARVTITGHLVE
jgi:hypothetical protein